MIANANFERNPKPKPKPKTTSWEYRVAMIIGQLTVVALFGFMASLAGGSVWLALWIWSQVFLFFQ